MAELDLKEIWKKGQQEVGQAEEIDIDQAVGKKSKSVLSTVNFILKIEFWLNNLITLPCAFLYYFEYGPIWAFVTGTLYLVYFFYYLFLIRSINRFDYAGEVKKSLKKIYGYLRFYVLHYRVMIWLCFAGIPWGILLFFIIAKAGGQDVSQYVQDSPKYDFSQTERYLVLAAYIIIPIIVAVGFNLLVGLLYGRRIKKLRKMIRDLD